MLLSKDNFTKGMAIFFSCGGPNPDVLTLKVWHQMLCRIEPKDFQDAIMALCQEEKELGSINFVAEITQRAKGLRNDRLRFPEPSAEQKQLTPGSDCVDKKMVQDLIKSLNVESVTK